MYGDGAPDALVCLGYFGFTSMCVGGDCTVGVFAEAVDRRGHEAEHPVQSGYVWPLACILMRHASPFIMMVSDRVFAAGAVQYHLLSGEARRERPYSLQIFVELSQWQTERGATPALHG
ncbi:uncharacterized protein LOC119316479 [Triticum dicoccoides]|uniref:uncharacterized protein LOC119316479 n=1 Tax=Triticum dicoccoides TaxID=85692 RepID=UPI00189161CC|nr:uncharacterized protein LOC119316479 [Triticum dicoccoides]XP_044408440.1 uncharacterized protein LOC123132653 isoform X2 [Triticum aestivum]